MTIERCTYCGSERDETCSFCRADLHTMTTSHAQSLRDSIAVYSEPMSAALVTLVIRNRGQAGLDRLVVQNADYIEAKRAELVALTAEEHLSCVHSDGVCHCSCPLDDDYDCATGDVHRR